jgi:hypothetical protein
MSQTADQPYKVYEKPDYSVLTEAARELGVELKINPDIRLAEDLFQRGVKTPGSENGWSPQEQVSIQQLLPTILEKHELPTALRVYLVDRRFIKPAEETFGSLLIREKKKKYYELLEGIHTLATSLKENKG